MATDFSETGVKTVVVIGAGAAGLQAANILLESDEFLKGRMKINVLEARDRIGGRILIDRKWNIPFDSGPNWIHGTLFNPLMPLAKISGSQLTLPDEANRTIYTSSGKALPTNISRRLFQRIWKYAGEAIVYSANPGECIPPDWSVYDFCQARIRDDEDLDLESKYFALQMVHLLTTFTAADVRKQSLRHYQVEDGLQGDCLFVASTFESMLQHLARPSKTAGILHLSTQVTDISIHSDRISVRTTTTTIEADAVILTVPLGCLQRSTITFSPPLPPRVQSAINNLGFGNLEKLFLKFKRAWWTTQLSADPPHIFTFLSPPTLPSAAPRQLLTIFSLANLPVHAQPVLVVYLAGAWSTYLTSKSSDEIMDLFESHYLPCLPNYTSECTIMDVFHTNWTHDPFSYGSYTHVPVGSLDGVDDLRILGEKIVGLDNGSGGLWFAGEHAGTSDLATVNGAMASGDLAAVGVLKSLE